MQIYQIKFGESGSGSYTDGVTIAADSITDAAEKAGKIAQSRINDSDARFEFDKAVSVDRKQQKWEWHVEAVKSWEPTSIIWQSDLEDVPE